jgi:hypothetical protein
MNPIAIFRSRQIPASYHPPRCKSAFAQIVKFTKMLHVKNFGTIAPRNRANDKPGASNMDRPFIHCQRGFPS